MENSVCIFVNSETEKGLEKKKEKLLEHCFVQGDFPVVVLSIRTSGNYFEEIGIESLMDLAEERIIDTVLVDSVSDITNSTTRLDEVLQKLTVLGVTLRTTKATIDFEDYHDFLCNLGIVKEEQVPWMLKLIKGLRIYDK